MRPLAGGVLVLLAVIAAGFVAQRLFGSGSDRMAEAEEAIEALPYRFSMHEVSDGVLAGTAHGHLGVVVRFVVTEDESRAGGLPPNLVHPDWSGSEAGGFWVWEDDAGLGVGSDAQQEERLNVSSAITESLCRKETGRVCPV